MSKRKSFEIFLNEDVENRNVLNVKSKFPAFKTRHSLQLKSLSSSMGALTNQASFGSGVSQFKKARVSFQDVRRSRSNEVISVSVNSDSLANFQPKSSIIEEFESTTNESESFENTDKHTELDELLQLLNDEGSNESESKCKTKRKIPSKNDGYAQQLYNILESCEADARFLKRDLEAGTLSDAMRLIVESIHESYGVYMAKVDGPQGKWQFILDDSWAQKVQKGSELIAFIEQTDIETAVVVDNHLTFLQPNKIFLVNS